MQSYALFPKFANIKPKNIIMRHFKLTGLTVMASLLCGSCCQEDLEGGWVSTDRHFTLKADGTSCKTGLDKAMLQDSAFTYSAW